MLPHVASKKRFSFKPKQKIDKYKPDAECKSQRLKLKDDEDASARKKWTPRAASQTAIQTLKDQIYQDPVEETQPLAGYSI